MAKKRVLGKRYEIDEVLGEGGMAKVFRGDDRVLNRTIAVKILSPQFAEDQQFVDRFRREAQSAAGLNHPNVVSVYDSGSQGNVHYIVMEYVQGRTLRDVIRQDGRLLPERVTEIAESVALALAAAHDKGLVHRDIKPGNIMLTGDGQVKVMDFGIARATSSDTITQTAAVLGTASYLSPEQAQGEPVDGRSDIYSLGVVLYELLTGRPPFSGDSPVTIAYKHVTEDPVEPGRLNPDVSDALDAIVMKAMAKNPDHRYQTAAEIGDDLRRAREGMPVAAPPVGAATTQVIDRASQTAVMTGPIDDEAEYYEEPQRRTGLIVGVTLLVLAILGLAAFFLVRSLLVGSELVPVPEVTGINETGATRILRQAGFKVDVEPRNNRNVEPGIVFEQDPEAGTEADEGSTVTIVVSLGIAQREVPSVVGETVEDAQTILGEAGFEDAVTEQASDEDEGIVISQSPEGGSQADRGSEVTIVVSSGPSTVAVPDVLCQSPSEAQAEIEDAELVYEESGEEFDTDCPAGTVSSQSPAPETQVAPGQTVRVTISLGASPSPSPTPTETPTA